MKHLTTLLLVLAFLSLTIRAGEGTDTSQMKSHEAGTQYNYKIMSGKYAVSGVQRVLIILVEFSDVRHATSTEEVRGVALDQVNSYFSEVSYGKVSITGQVYGWYTAGHSIGYYGSDSKKPGDDRNVRSLASDALALVPSNVDISPFDLLVVVHAGKDQSADQSEELSDEIWSSCFCAVFPYYEQPNPVYGHLKSFANYAFLSEFNGVGTYAHELGHYFGLPDLYDTNEGKDYVGYWSLMDDGNWCCYNREQATPSYIGAWGDTLLGWLSPHIPDSDVFISFFDLKPLESAQATAILIPISSSTYYFVEYRIQKGRDSNLPTSGLLIYFVDERIDSGKGVLRLVNPKTMTLFAPQRPKGLLEAAFKVGDRFRDSTNQVYIAFVSGTEAVTTIYSRQESTGSFMNSNLKTSISKALGVYSEEIVLSIILVDANNGPLGSQSVRADIFDHLSGQWVNVGSGLTAQNGTVTLLIDLGRTYGVGNYRFRLLYPGGKIGNVWYFSASTEMPLEIVPARMTVSVLAPGYGFDKIPIEILAVGPQRELLAGVTLRIYVNGVQEATVTTNDDGKASWIQQVSPAELGARNITVTATLANYIPTQASTTVLAVSWSVVMIIIIILGVGTYLVTTKLRGRRKVKLESARCPKCGESIPRDSLFCPECGTEIHFGTT